MGKALIAYSFPVQNKYACVNEEKKKQMEKCDNIVAFPNREKVPVCMHDVVHRMLFYLKSLKGLLILFKVVLKDVIDRIVW